MAYDFSAIDACRRGLDEAEAAWTGFFDCTGITPFEVAYEEVRDRYAAPVCGVARRLGADIDAADVTAPRLRRQADGHSERLLARYRRERATRC